VRVEVTRSGGITGAVRSAVADSRELDAAASTELVRLLDACSLGQDDTAGSAGEPPPRAPDRFQYDVTVRRGADVASFVRSEPELSGPEQQLLRWVLSRT
jgi:hypothetical protein